MSVLLAFLPGIGKMLYQVFAWLAYTKTGRITAAVLIVLGCLWLGYRHAFTSGVETQKVEQLRQDQKAVETKTRIRNNVAVMHEDEVDKELDQWAR